MNRWTRDSGFVLVLGALLAAGGCTRTVTAVHSVTPEEYSSNSWIGRTSEDIHRAWGDGAQAQPDGLGGTVIGYTRMESHSVPPITAQGPYPGPAGSPGSFQPELGVVWVSTPSDLARFWLDANGKVYRFWFADEVYRKGLDRPEARPVEKYGRKSA